MRCDNLVAQRLRTHAEWGEEKGVNLIPVIERELRSAARQPATQWLRPLSAGVGVIIAAVLLLGPQTGRPPGPELFARLHHAAMVMLWILVPLMTADCISRERRDETLGLLFLTPLRSGEVVLAKVLVQGLRAATVGASVWPVVLVPLLMGGVTAATIWTAFCAQLGAFCWALAAGILASVLSRTVLQGLAWATLFALLFLVAHAVLNGLAVENVLQGLNARRQMPSAEWLTGIGLVSLWSPEYAVGGYFRIIPPASVSYWLKVSSMVPLASALGVAMVWGIAAWRLRRAWREQPPSPGRERVAREFVRLRYARERFRVRRRAQLERNPVGWLERRRWTSRAAGWLWVGLLALSQWVALTVGQRVSEIEEMLAWLLLALLGAVAMVSVASLRRERETGVLELLLTTPLSPQSIMSGRLRGLYGQFAMAILLAVGVTASLEFQLNTREAPEFWEVLEILSLWAICLLMLPVGGLWLSLRARGYVAGLLATVVVMVLFPWSLGTIPGYWWPTWRAGGWWMISGAAGLMGWSVWILRTALGPVAPLAGAAGLFLLARAFVLESGSGSVLRPADVWRLLVPACVMMMTAAWSSRRLQRELEARGAGPASGTVLS